MCIRDRCDGVTYEKDLRICDVCETEGDVTAFVNDGLVIILCDMYVCISALFDAPVTLVCDVEG